MGANDQQAMSRRASLALLTGAGLCAARPSFAQAPAPLRIGGMISAIELGPVYLALEKFYPGNIRVALGGIPNLFPEHWGGPIRGLDVAGHAEIQALRNSVAHPNVRIIFTVALGHYRLVARRSKGIRRLEDLRGRTIATMYPTSSGFYLSNMLGLVGLTVNDVKIVSQLTLEGIADPILKGDADAFTLWEPYMEMTVRALGDDAILFEQDPGFAENYNLNTIAENLADPVLRPKIVELTAAMILATADVRKDPSRAITLAAEMAKQPREPIAASYHHHSFPGRVADGLLDTLVKGEAWLAPQSGRAPRSRAELARLIDTSVVDEARELIASGHYLPGTGIRSPTR